MKTAYSYGEAENTIDPGSIAAGSWQNNPHAADPNNPGLGISAQAPGHRFFIGAAYTKDYFGWGGTTISAFWESRTIGNASYIVRARHERRLRHQRPDLRPARPVRDELRVVLGYRVGVTRRSRPAEQAAAWDAYINQDKYLSTRRGQYAERGALWLPMVHRLDFAIAQNAFANFFGKRNAFQFRVDIDNFTNLLNSDWGVGQRTVASFGQVLTNPGVDAQGRATYRLRTVTTANGVELIKNTFETDRGHS